MGLSSWLPREPKRLPRLFLLDLSPFAHQRQDTFRFSEHHNSVDHFSSLEARANHENLRSVDKYPARACRLAGFQACVCGEILPLCWHEAPSLLWSDRAVKSTPWGVGISRDMRNRRRVYGEPPLSLPKARGLKRLFISRCDCGLTGYRPEDRSISSCYRNRHREAEARN